MVSALIGALVAIVLWLPSAASIRLRTLTARRARRSAVPLVADVALVLDLVAAALAAGLPTGRALAVVAAAIVAVERSVAESAGSAQLDSGGRLAAAMEAWPGSVGTPTPAMASVESGSGGTGPADQLQITLGSALAAAAAALDLGARLDDAWPAGLPPEVRAVTSALQQHLQICDAGGVPATPVLRAGAQDRRRRIRREREAQAARLGVRLVLPLGLCALPAFLLLCVVPVLSQLTGELIR